MELNDFIKKISKAKEGTRFSEERKRALRGRILYLVNLQEKPETRAASFFAPVLRPAPILAGALVLLLAGGSVSFAAEKSLPGDLLYPVKININENLIAVLQFTPAAQAAWQVDKTERRLTEASALIAEGTSDPRAQAQVQASFDDTANQAQASIQALDDEGQIMTAAEVAAKLEAVLKAHAQILNAVSLARDRQNSSSILATSTLSLENNLSDNLAKVEAVKALIQAKIASTSDERAVSSEARVKIDKARARINSVKKFVADNSDKLSVGAVNEADQKLSEAGQGLENAQGKLKQNQAGEAFNSANDAAEVAQKVQLLLQANLNLGIPSEGDLNATSSMETSSTDSGSTSTQNDSGYRGNSEN